MRPVLEIDPARRPVGRQRARSPARTAPARASSRRRFTPPRRAPASGLVTVNAGGLSEGVFESELFGHVKGAFTDAKTDRVGRFELADGGTLFLDEIANVPLNLQPKLLRVLETGEFERVGSSRTRQVNVRILSATNARLGGRGRGRPLPPGSAVPPEHDRDPAAAAARAPRGHSRARRRTFCAQHARRYRKTHHRLRAGRHAGARSTTPGPATSASSTTPSSAAC